MRISSLALTVLVGLGPASLALADTDADRERRVQEALANLPTEADIEEMTASLPDMTGMLMSFKAMAEDKETQARLERIGNTLETRLGNLDLDTTEGEIPDLNGLIGEMMSLSTDRQLMGDVLNLAFEVQDIVEESVGAMETPDGD